jgi:hypothetical protein
MKRLIGRIRAFFYVFSRSAVAPAYYKDILETRINFTVKYFLSLAIAASAITALILTVQLTPVVNKAVESVATEAKDAYPQDFELTIKDQQWSINKPEPYAIPMPEDFYNEITKDKSVKIPRNLIVLDKKGTIEDVYKQDTLALINEKYILSLNDENGIHSSPLQNLPDGKLDKAAFDKFINQAVGIKKFIPFFMAGGILIFSLFVNLVIRLLGFLFVAIFVWAAANIMKLGLNYQQSLRITLHAGTLPITVNLLSVLFGYGIPIPSWFSLLTVIYALIALFTIRNQRKQTVLETQ